MTFWKGSWRGSQEDSRKKEEGCVQDPEEEKAAEFRASRVERSKVSRTSNKSSANSGPTGWDNRDMVWSGYDQKLLQTHLCHLLDV